MNPGCDQPSIVSGRFDGIGGNCDETLIVWTPPLGISNSIVSAAEVWFALLMAARSDPAPESLVLVTKRTAGTARDSSDSKCRRRPGWERAVGLGRINQLAPGQCIMYTLEGATVTAPPENCQVVAQRALAPNIAFWTAPFGVRSVTDGRERSCPAGLPTRLTLCIVPR